MLHFPGERGGKVQVPVFTDTVRANPLAKQGEAGQTSLYRNPHFIASGLKISKYIAVRTKPSARRTLRVSGDR